MLAPLMCLIMYMSVCLSVCLFVASDSSGSVTAAMQTLAKDFAKLSLNKLAYVHVFMLVCFSCLSVRFLCLLERRRANLIVLFCFVLFNEQICNNPQCGC